MKTDNTVVSPEPLLNYFDGIIPLKSEEKELVMAKFHARLFRKRQFVLQEGDFSKIRKSRRLYQLV